MPSLVRLEQLRNVGDQRIIGVWVSEKRTNTEQNLANRQCRTPLVLENVQTNSAIRVDVAVINACREMNLGRLYTEQMGSNEIKRNSKPHRNWFPW